MVVVGQRGVKSSGGLGGDPRNPWDPNRDPHHAKKGIHDYDYSYEPVQGVTLKLSEWVGSGEHLPLFTLSLFRPNHKLHTHSQSTTVPTPSFNSPAWAFTFGTITAFLTLTSG